MPVIKILPEALANKISAGEVIERPASIVKELVENALDAGATQIEVSVKHGGKSLLRVADNGCGMSPADAELAFQRYATSKISTAEDLDRIASFGFRGEALPSIAAVSRVKMTTRLKGKASGTEMTVEGGHVSGAKESPCKEGTVMEVRDLFFNTPARRKFLKSDSTENGHIYEMVANLALSRPDVRFVYKENDKTELDLLPGQSVQDRAASIWGKEIGKYLVPFDTEISGVRIRGVIAKPHAARANRTGQIFFINNRWVKSFSLSYALQAGFHGMLMHGQYPMAVLFVDLDLSRVDVNVHPTKQEVRISNEAEVKSLLKDAVSQALLGTPDLAPQMKAREFPSHPISTPAPRPSGAGRRDLPAFLYSSFKDEPEQSGVAEAVPAFEAKLKVQVEPELLEAISLRDKLRITKILGQIHRTFIVAETDEGLMLIDQHAAHERVMFEALVKNFDASSPVSQRLLMEEVVEFHPKQIEILKKSLKMLTKTGFEIEEFGKNTYVIRSVPAIFEKESAALVLKTFLEEKEEGRVKTSLEGQKEDIAALIACKKKSVRAYDPLSPVQMQALLERLALCENPFNCPHGRPSVLKYSFEELEKQFKRKL